MPLITDKLFPLINRGIDVFEKYSITLAFAVATLMLFTNVVLRYIFDTGFFWVLELVQYLFAWVVLVGAAHGVKVGIHLGINIILERLAPRARHITLVFAITCCIVFVAIVDYQSILYTLKIQEWGDITQDLQIPQWIPYLAIPIGLSLMLYHFLVLGYDIVRGKRKTIHTSDSPHIIEELEQ